MIRARNSNRAKSEESHRIIFEVIKNGSAFTTRLYLARMYERGDGVDTDFRKAVQLYKDETQLLPWARPYFEGFYGLCLIRGRAVRQGQKTGWKLVQKSIKGQNAARWYVKGECFRNGYGVETNPVEAAACHQRAIQMENGMDRIVF